MSLPTISGLTMFLGTIVFLVLIIITKLLIVPIYRLQYYKKQGIYTKFIPGTGWISTMKQAEKEHGDNLYYVKQNARDNPDRELEAYNIGDKVFLLLYSPRVLKALFTTIEPYQKYKALQPITLFSKWGFTMLNGKIFRQHRKTVCTMFSFTILGDKVPTMRENARITIENIVKNSTKLKDVDMLEHMLAYTGDNVGDLFFGGHIKSYTIGGKAIVPYTVDLQADSGYLTRTLSLLIFGPGILKYGLLKSHREFNAKVQNFRNVVTQIIEDRRAQGESQSTDLIKVLLDTQKSDDPNIAYTDEMIIDEYIGLFVAGAENPSHILVLALYLLDTHPQFKKQLINEISEIYDKEPLNYHTLHKMSHLHGLIQETIRLHSPSFSTQPKVAVKDFELEHFKVKKGTLMMPVFFHQNYSDKVFEDAFKFKPERWIDGSMTMEPFKFIPFAAGPRNCVGQHYAGLEMKVMICEFLKAFDYYIDPNYKLLKTQRFLNVPKNAIPFNLSLKK